MDYKTYIESGKATLGIEFGSTRIKGVLIDENGKVLAAGGYDWHDTLVEGIWTYDLEEVFHGLKSCYKELKENVKEQYGITLKNLASIGISGMMHGYLPFNKDGKLLSRFRTWRNTMTKEAVDILIKEFNYNIPQRFSIAHLYQCILDGQEHVRDIDYFCTLSAFIHWKLSGEKVIGIGEGSGMFPVDIHTKNWNQKRIEKFNHLISKYDFSWKIEDILPKVLAAGENAGYLTKEGALLLDPEGDLISGIPMCPPEGDAGTGMTATNSVTIRTGNVSVGTSVFLMAVLEKELSKVHEEIDMVTTPAGDAVAMIQCNNCSSDLDAWMRLFKENLELFGLKVSTSQLYEKLFNIALEGDADCGGLLAYNYFGGEHITHLQAGRHMFVRKPDDRFNLANFMRTHLYTAFGALATGMKILNNEQVVLENIYGHGGIFKTEGVAQRILAAAIHAPVTVMDHAGEGGSWGVALLASFMVHKKENESLSSFLKTNVFTNSGGTKLLPMEKDVEGYKVFLDRYTKGLAIEQIAVEKLK
ncbi:MAG: ATPase [Firmicutes bacterium]|nr:ATPase [Bacillota bacterium]